jgi:hypothetical protein
MYPANRPPAIINTIASTTFIGSIKANGRSNQGIGDTVPGGLLIILKCAAESSASAPSKMMYISKWRSE